MPELSQEMIGNILMALGLGGAGTYLTRGLWVPKIAAFFSNQKNTTESKDILEDYSVHDIVEILIEDRKDAEDEEGVMLIGTFGKHIYDYYIQEDKKDESK